MTKFLKIATRNLLVITAALLMVTVIGLIIEHLDKPKQKIEVKLNNSY
jgi:hypothetical protein